LLRRFDALGDDIEFQALGHGKDCLDDRDGGGITRHFVDVARKIANALASHPIPIGDYEHYLSASIGFTVRADIDGQPPVRPVRRPLIASIRSIFPLSAKMTCQE
jgi:hypothetical protein